MKRIFESVIVLLISVAIAHAADVTVKVVMTTGPKDEPVTTFAPDTPKIFAMFETTGIAKGDKVRGDLIAEDVGDAAPANTQVLSKTLTLDEDTTDGTFTFSKPNKDWPPGKYRVEMYVNDELVTKAKFAISGGGTAADKTESSAAAEVPDEAELKSMTDSSILSFGRAVKKKDFAGFYEEIASVWQKQTTPEKLQAAFEDFYNKNIDLPSALKDKEPVFNHPAKINPNGVLVVQGYYPTKPNRVVFQLKFFKDESDWKLVGVDVNLKE
jgi:hypothetical protein